MEYVISSVEGCNGDVRTVCIKRDFADAEGALAYANSIVRACELPWIMVVPCIDDKGCSDAV